MKLIKNIEGVDFYEYTPTLFAQYYMKYPGINHPFYEKRIAHKIRMMIEYLRGGYKVYYMAADDNIIGHIVVTPGGRRLSVSDKTDIVLGPIFISPDLRGRGYGTIGINVVLNHLDLKYRYAYEFIQTNNIASIKTVKKNGYIFFGNFKEKGLLRKLVKCKDGNYAIYRYTTKQ